MTKHALLWLAICACVDKGAGPQHKKIEPAYVTANLVAAVPADVQRADVSLGGAVVYAGNKVERDTLAPGQPGKITHYWQVLRPPGPGWRVFAILRGEPKTADFMYLPATDMELGHPPETWKSGEIIQDVQDFVLRPDWRSKTATLEVGLIQVGGHDVGDRMPALGPSVVDRAIVARTWQVDLSKAPPPAGTVYVPHAAGPITIDGVAAEPGWQTAAVSPELVTAEGSPEPVGKATARMTWDEQNLYVFVSVIDSDVYSQYKQHDDPLWKQDAIEIFIDADGNRRGYVELQVNPNNATFDSWFASTRAQPGDEKWDSGMVTAVKVRGTADVAGDTDQGWDVEIAIPLAAVKGRDQAMNVRIPPQVGDRWRLNVVRVDAKSGGGSPSASSWNRITYQDFHALDRMLTIVFADTHGRITTGLPSTDQRPAQTPPPPAPPPPTAPPPPQGSGSGSAMIMSPRVMRATSVPKTP
ncbi:MAG: carbohydrate-binding family 9-like protein [Acidobacteriota bacterium]